ncbi:MAG: hypothetical protein L0Z50_16865 [Verrucomicrobiales bacterium]|nr:hypothetical protein [Verrucomicrobiales bacterium]
MNRLFFLSMLVGATLQSVSAADRVFSGPQPNEKTTPFKTLELTGPNAGKERDPVTANAGAPTMLVFLHAIERSLVPLLRVVDQYGAERTNLLKSEIIFLSGDKLDGEQRMKAAARSLQLQSHVSLSLDGSEGPGNYGLNKECMMTILVAKDNKVTANFALVQPGIADAPKVLEALAKTCGDSTPPSVEQLSDRQMARAGAGRERGGRMQRDGAGMERRRSEPVDFSKLDLNTEAGLRDSVRALIAEVQSLRTEVNELRGRGEKPGKEDTAAQPKEEFPGAVPTDPKLNTLLRQFIRPTNDDATVDKLMVEIESHVKGNPDLTTQAIDGWTRILHFGDRYGTAYARKVGRELLDKLKPATRRE